MRKVQEETKMVEEVGSKHHKEVAELAYRYFVDRGRHHGHDKEDWYKAEQAVKNKSAWKK